MCRFILFLIGKSRFRKNRILIERIAGLFPLKTKATVMQDYGLDKTIIANKHDIISEVIHSTEDRNIAIFISDTVNRSPHVIPPY